MKMLDVYPLYPIEPIKGKDCFLWDCDGNEYLDMYGGHAVISIGHGHAVYIQAISDQLGKLSFYSNSIINSLQDDFAEKLGKISGYENYSLFMCNSGAEANENALKLASFHNRKDTVIAFENAFHGRTSGAVACTNNASLVSMFNAHHKVNFFPLNQLEQVEKRMKQGDISSVIIEGIQGIGGINVPELEFMTMLSQICKKYDVILILDEIQSGYGRTGKFFAHQHFGIRPDIISIAKGMGNGFPLGGILIHEKIKTWHGMLGSTFGGNHLACAAALAVIKTIENEKLMQRAWEMGAYFMNRLNELKEIKEIRGLGLMIGIEFEIDIKGIRDKLLHEKHIFTGYSGSKTIRLLPPLTIGKSPIDYFIRSLKKVLQQNA